MKPRRVFGRLYLRLDNSDTPAMLFAQSHGKVVASGTYWCVAQEGFDGIELTDRESDWIGSLEFLVDAHVEAQAANAVDPADGRVTG